MNIIRIIILLAASTIMACCGNGKGGDKRLEAIDSLLNKGMVDSAYSEIQKVQAAELKTTEDSALFFLLRTQAQYRLYKPTAPMEWLDFSIRHFSAGNTEKDKLATAYFYKGAILYDCGDVKNGVNLIKNAEFIAEKTGNAELKHKIYECLLVVNEEAGDYATAIGYSKKSVDESLKERRNDWLAHAYNNMAVLFAKVHKTDSAKAYLEKSMTLLKKIPQKDCQYIMNNIGVYFMNNDPETAKRYFRKVIDIAPMDAAYENLANIYAAEGDSDTAERLWAKALETEDLLIKDEVMHSMFRFQMESGDYGKAAKTAERLIELKDSLTARRTGNNVKAILADFDRIKSRQEYERKTTLAVVCVSILALVAIIMILYYRYKTYKTKAAMAQDQLMIRDYERQVADLQRFGKDKEKEIEAINKRKEKLIDKHRDTLNRGYVLFTDVNGGKTTVLWKKHDFESVIEYYRLIDTEFVGSIETTYDELSPKYKFFLILEHIGKTDKEIMATMGVAEVSLRSIRSRVNKRKRNIS